MHLQKAAAVGIALLALAALTFWQWQWDIAGIESFIQTNIMLGGMLYVLVVILSIIALPLTSLPLLPVAVRLFGIVPAALLSIFGWWIGAMIAFWIARKGRPWIAQVVSLEGVDRLTKRIPPDIGFAGIVFLRMILPVDVTSFALGLVKNLTFGTYAVATLIGIIPFAFAWSYAGGALGHGQFVVAALVAIAMTAAVLLLRRLWKVNRS